MSYTEKEFQAMLRNPAVKISIDGLHPGFHPTMPPGKIEAAGGIIEIPKGRSEPKRGKPNKTESEYAKMLALEFPGCAVRFEALGLKLDNGHVYTPDWVVKQLTGQILCVEVKARGKNGFRHPSYQRAKLAYDQARLDFSMFQFRWAEKQAGVWGIS